MSGATAAMVGAVVLGLVGLGLAILGPGDQPVAAPDRPTLAAECGSCDARHQRLGETRLTIVEAGQ